MPYSILFPLSFYLAHGPRFPWYLVPLNWSSLVIGAVGVLWLNQKLEGLPALREKRPMVFLIAIFGLAFVARDAEKFHEYKILQENEVGLRKEVGHWLDQNTPKASTVAMEAIGYQGYHANRTVIDMAGLISPEVVALATENKRPHQMFHAIVHELQPDYLVLRSYEVEQNKHMHGGKLFDNEKSLADFNARYERAIELQAPNLKAWGKNAKLSIYAKK